MLIIRDGWGINPGGRGKARRKRRCHFACAHAISRPALSRIPGRQVKRERSRCRFAGRPNGELGSRSSQPRGRPDCLSGSYSNQQGDRGRRTRLAIRSHGRPSSARAAIGSIFSDWFPMVAFTVITSILLLSLEQAKAAGVTDILVHAFTDGRDTSPTGGAGFLEACASELTKCGARIATVVGRYFAMDRDRRWDRTKKAWDAIVFGRGERCETSPAAAVRAQYEQRYHG